MNEKDIRESFAIIGSNLAKIDAAERKPRQSYSKDKLSDSEKKVQQEEARLTEIKMEVVSRAMYVGEQFFVDINRMAGAAERIAKSLEKIAGKGV